MAKKTAKKKTGPKKKAVKKAPAAKKAPKKKKAPAAKKSAAPKPVLDEAAIGHAAGAVWVALRDGPLTLATLKKAVDHPTETTVMAIGWLAREQKLDFDASGRSVRVRLR